MYPLTAIVLALLVLPAPALAGEVSTRLAAGLLAIEQADNLSGRGHATINALDAKPRPFTRLLAVPLLEVRYTHQGSSIFVGSPVDEPAGLNLGYRRQLDKGAVGGNVFYSGFGREWQNPYLVGIPRNETRVHTYGGRISFEDVGGVPLQLAVKGTVKQVGTEGLSGNLRRDGAKLEVELSWRQHLRDGWAIVPLAAYQRGDYQGAVNSYHGGSLGLGADWHGGDVRLITRLHGNLTAYDQSHPVFNKTRRDHGYRISSMVILDKPFAWQRCFASAGVIHQAAASSIDFFATRTTIGLVTIGYKF